MKVVLSESTLTENALKTAHSAGFRPRRHGLGRKRQGTGCRRWLSNCRHRISSWRKIKFPA